MILTNARKIVFAILLAIPLQMAIPQKLTIRPPAEEACKWFAINSEARGEGPVGMKAVLDTVERRMKVRKQTACEVVMAPKQFSAYVQGTYLLISEKELTQLQKISNMSPVVKQAEYFHSVQANPTWKRGMKRIAKIKNHIFYKPPPQGKTKEK